MAITEGIATYTERMVPDDAHARIFWEHIARYRFAKSFVRGKRVLDIACGEGYGAAALIKSGALSVIGIDNKPDICKHAQNKYNIDARFGDAQAIPLENQSIDVVVSFETIEHIKYPDMFISECARVLIPQGMLIVSTPNRPVYSSNNQQNPFHQHEFDEGEFLDLLGKRFWSVRLYTQLPQSVAWWSLRSLVAEQSPWLRIRGFWRLSSWFCPTIRTYVDPVIRGSTDDAILMRSSILSSLFDPYLVRVGAKRNQERPYFLIAVAQGVKSA